jgi:hypothetical protein
LKKHFTSELLEAKNETEELKKQIEVSTRDNAFVAECDFARGEAMKNDLMKSKLAMKAFMCQRSLVERNVDDMLAFGSVNGREGPSKGYYDILVESKKIVFSDYNEFDCKVINAPGGYNDFSEMTMAFNIDILYSLQSLTYLNLADTDVQGDIKVFTVLSNLTEFNLNNTEVFGNIEYLKELQNLNKFFLHSTGVTGDIKLLPKNLTEFSLGRFASDCLGVGVTGDIQILQEFPKLTEFNLYGTGVTGDIQVLPNNLTEFNLMHTGVTGDIQFLPKNLTGFGLSDTGVTGDIQDLPKNLTTFNLKCTGVTGDIVFLKELEDLTEFYLNDTCVTGDIQVLKELPKLRVADLKNTKIASVPFPPPDDYTEELIQQRKNDVMNANRKKSGLNECEFRID